MPILVTCQKCMQQATVPDEFAGKKIRCKACSAILVAQPSAAAPLAPVAATPPSPFTRPKSNRSLPVKQIAIGLATLGIVGLLGIGVSFAVSWYAYPSYSTVLSRLVSTTEGLADSLAKVSDHDSAKRQKTTVEGYLSTMVALMKRRGELIESDTPDASERRRLEQEFQPKLREALASVSKESKRLNEIPLAAQELREPMIEFGQKMLELSSQQFQKQFDQFMDGGNSSLTDNNQTRPGLGGGPGPSAGPQFSSRPPSGGRRPPIGGNRMGPGRGGSRFRPPPVTDASVRQPIEQQFGRDRTIVVKISDAKIHGEVFRRMMEIVGDATKRKRGQGCGVFFAIAPVDDIQAFAALIDFGTVTKVDEATRTIEVSSDTSYKYRKGAGESLN